ncbi:MAG: FIG00471148: hypothetical protein [uncultured Sulfurovum sp.]|uniref:Uncharacterized protein n=1 Tax=uncultured Sulfurovum sp. TaxID=269237 RepID=A0A6S6UEI7_9BACT|nr:MAG: FIG00471148: hypothetical protein [uncultured Sulfurovum sp.]
MAEKNQIDEDTNNIDQVYNVFKFISEEGNQKFYSLYILNYLYNFIVSDEVAKRKTSARVFEDLLAILLNGNITDTKSRKNLQSDVPDYFRFTKDKIAGNKREKIDLLFNNNYGVSVKTLMKNNKEINLGSFEKKVLFDDFGILNVLTERKTSNETQMGLGSKPQLKNLFEHLEQNNQYNEFKIRLVNMFDYIFSDDMILAIKDKTKLELYFIEGSEFTQLIENHSHDINDLLTILNRWEGNSIRIDRTKLINTTRRKVVLDFSILDRSIMKKINDFDELLHTNYIKYFHEENREEFEYEIILNIDILFKEFEQNFGELS